MVALLHSGALIGAWKISKSLDTVGLLQRYEAEHFVLRTPAIVMCADASSALLPMRFDQRIEMLGVLRALPRLRLVPVLESGACDALEWAAFAPPPPHAKTLSEHLINHGALSEALAAALLRDLLDALLELPHLRLRPDVLWLDDSLLLTAISEYGTAHLFSALPSPFDPCVAPEQHARTHVEASDMYACGVILYEAVTGLEPFGDEDFFVAQTVTRELPSVSIACPRLEHAGAFDVLIQKLTRKAMHERPALEEARRDARALARLVGSPRAAPLPVFDVRGALEHNPEDPLDLLLPQSERRPARTLPAVKELLEQKPQAKELGVQGEASGELHADPLAMLADLHTRFGAETVEEDPKPNASEIGTDVPVPQSNDGGKPKGQSAGVVSADPARQGARSRRATLAAALILSVLAFANFRDSDPSGTTHECQSTANDGETPMSTSPLLQNPAAASEQGDGEPRPAGDAAKQPEELSRSKRPFLDMHDYVVKPLNGR